MPVIPAAPPESTGLSFFEHEGARLRYRDTARTREAGRPVLVFVHGWALDLRMWQPQFDALPHCRVVLLDRRGFGGSTGTPGPEGDAGDLLALLDRLAIARAFVIGMSQGARAALALASLAPVRIAGLVLDGAPAIEGLLADDVGPDEVPVTELLHILRAEGIAALHRAVATHPLMELRTRETATHALLARMIAEYPGTDLGSRVHSTPQRVDLTAIHVPVLVLNGVHDTAHRKLVGDAYCRTLPRAERALIDAAGHLPNLDNPAEYNATLTGFIGHHAHAA